MYILLALVEHNFWTWVTIWGPRPTRVLWTSERCPLWEATGWEVFGPSLPSSGNDVRKKDPLLESGDLCPWPGSAISSL